MKRIALTIAVLALLLASCQSDAEVAANNISKAADSFQIPRRIIFYNGITDKYILDIEGYCSITDEGNQLEVTCKTGPTEFKKHFLGLSDNVTYVAEQLDPGPAVAVRRT